MAPQAVIAGGLEPCLDQGVNARGLASGGLECVSLSLLELPSLITLPTGLVAILDVEDLRQLGHCPIADVIPAIPVVVSMRPVPQRSSPLTPLRFLAADISCATLKLTPTAGD